MFNVSDSNSKILKLIRDSNGKISRLLGMFGMIVSMTVGFYLILSAGAIQSKLATFLVSLGMAAAFSGLTFKALLKSQR
jgi:hypothetical protein|uniref:hypothetical protein n=1 Tax=Polynucleobacter sp. TaxID=2029855 RepID=UPI004048D761